MPAKVKADTNATVSEKLRNKEVARELAKRSPKLEKLIRVQVDNNTTVFVPEDKLNKYGVDYYKAKYDPNRIISLYYAND